MIQTNDDAVNKFIHLVPEIDELTHPPSSAAYMHQGIRSALVKVMACHLFGTKPLSKPMLGYCQLDP